MQQQAFAVVDDGEIARCALGDHHIAAKRGVIGRQAALRRHIGDLRVAQHRHFVVQPQHGAQRQFAIEEATRENDHHTNVGEDVAQAICAACFGGDERIAFGGGRLLEFPAARLEMALYASERACAIPCEAAFGFMVEGAQAILTRVLAKVAHFAQKFRRVAINAQAGAHHQKQQNGDKPPGVVDRVERQRVEHGVPKLAELIDVVIDRLVLLEHRADNRRNHQHGEQANGKAHGT